MGDKLLLNFGVKIKKVAMATYFPYFSVPRCGQVNGDNRALKDALKSLNTRKSTSGFQQVLCQKIRKNGELESKVMP